MKLMLGPTTEYFLWAMAIGIVLAIVYDILRLSRRMIKTADIVVNIEDIIFILLAGGAAAALAYIVNNGVFRIYSLVGIGIGFVIYRITLGNRLIKLFMIVYGFILKTVKFLLKGALVPVGFVLRLIKKPLFIVIRKTSFNRRRIKDKTCEKEPQNID